MLPSSRRVILSDTVGFISELPTELVAAFRATLEEVAGADIILHVRDAAHLDTEAQRADVVRVLDGMAEDGTLDADWSAHTIEVLNKADLLGRRRASCCPARRRGGFGPHGRGLVPAEGGGRCPDIGAPRDGRVRHSRFGRHAARLAVRARRGGRRADQGEGRAA